MVTPTQLAVRLGVHPTTLRRWLRDLVGQGHQIARGHQPWERWVFSVAESRALAELYLSDRHGLAGPLPGRQPARVDRLGTALTPLYIDSLAVDDRTRSYLQTIVTLPAVDEAQAADAAFKRPAAQTLVLWHEPSAWATHSGLGLYLLDLELRRVAGVLPSVYPQLRVDVDLLEDRAQRVPIVPVDVPDLSDDRVARTESRRPRPLPAQRARLQIVDAAPGTFDVLLQGVGTLIDVLNSHGVLALATAITLAQGGRPFAKRGAHVLRVAALKGKRLTIAALRKALRALDAEPHGRFAVLVRVEPSGTVTVVVVDGD